MASVRLHVAIVGQLLLLSAAPALADDVLQGGYVYDRVTQQPVAQAHVVVVSSAARREADTDDLGFFHIPLSATQGVTLKVRTSKKGYRTSDQELPVSATYTWRIPLTRQPSTASPARPPEASDEQILRLLTDLDASRRAIGVALLARRGPSGAWLLFQFLTSYQPAFREIAQYEGIGEAAYLASILGGTGISADVRNAVIIELLRQNRFTPATIEAWIGLDPGDAPIARALAVTAREMSNDIVVSRDGRCSHYHAIAALDVALAKPGPATYAVLKRTIDPGPRWGLCMLPLATDADRPALIESAVGRLLAKVDQNDYVYAFVGVQAARQYPQVMIRLLPAMVRLYIDQRDLLESRDEDSAASLLRKSLLLSIEEAGSALPADVVEQIAAYVPTVAEYMQTSVCDILGALKRSRLDTPAVRALYAKEIEGPYFDCARDTAAWGWLQFNVDLSAETPENHEWTEHLLHVLRRSFDLPLRMEVARRLNATKSDVLGTMILIERLIKNGDDPPQTTALDSIRQELAVRDFGGAYTYYDVLDRDYYDAQEGRNRSVPLWLRPLLIDAFGIIMEKESGVLRGGFATFVVGLLRNKDASADECVAAADALTRMRVNETLNHEAQPQAAEILTRAAVTTRCKQHIIRFISSDRNDPQVAKALRASAKSKDDGIRTAAEAALAGKDVQVN